MKFINTELNEKYIDKGYLQIPFLETEDIDKISVIVKKYLHFKHSFTFIQSHQILDIETSIKMNDEILQIVQPAIEKYIIDFNIFFSVVASKGNQANSQLKFHTDRCFIDEQIHLPINLWLPLCDVSKYNGTLGVFESSHKFTYTYRGINNFEYYMAPEYYNFIEQNCIKYLNVSKGEIVFYQPGLIHGSSDNQSSEIRHALIITLLPKDADIIYCYQNQHWSNVFKYIDVYKADFDFWIQPVQPEPKNILKLLYRRRNTKPKIGLNFLNEMSNSN